VGKYVEPDRQQMTNGECAFRAGYLSVHILKICNNYYFSTTTMVHERASMLQCTHISYLVQLQTIFFNTTFNVTKTEILYCF
jgi:hypothetical protein